MEWEDRINKGVPPRSFPLFFHFKDPGGGVWGIPDRGERRPLLIPRLLRKISLFAYAIITMVREEWDDDNFSFIVKSFLNES